MPPPFGAEIVDVWVPKSIPMTLIFSKCVCFRLARERERERERERKKERKVVPRQ